MAMYDNAMPATERNLDGMKRGVRASDSLLIFLSGRKERNGLPDVNGEYEGPFTRPVCHEEMAAAREAKLNIVGLMETDPRFGQPNFAEEKRRALTGGRDGGPVSAAAAENVKLLDELCFIPRRTQAHEIPTMINEINRQGFRRQTDLLRRSR